MGEDRHRQEIWERWSLLIEELEAEIEDDPEEMVKLAELGELMQSLSPEDRVWLRQRRRREQLH